MKDNMISFFKKFFHVENISADSKPESIDAEGARNLIKTKENTERLDYERRRNGLLKQVYQHIKASAMEGNTSLTICNGLFPSSWTDHLAWRDPQDIRWFAHDFEQEFIRQGYEFSSDRSSITISWRR